MRKKDVCCIIKELKKQLPHIENIIFRASFGTHEWQEIKKIVMETCERKKLVYVSKLDLTNAAIQEIRTQARKNREKEMKEYLKNKTEGSQQIPTATEEHCAKNTDRQEKEPYEIYDAVEKILGNMSGDYADREYSPGTNKEKLHRLTGGLYGSPSKHTKKICPKVDAAQSPNTSETLPHFLKEAPEKKENDASFPKKYFR